MCKWHSKFMSPYFWQSFQVNVLGAPFGVVLIMLSIEVEKWMNDVIDCSDEGLYFRCIGLISAAILEVWKADMGILEMMLYLIQRGLKDMLVGNSTLI